MRHNQAGFTLIEVMVAFVIAALATIVVLRAGFDGIAQNTVAARYEQAVVRAQSRLASLGTLTPLMPESLSGPDGGGYFWRLRISRLQSSGPVALYGIVLIENFGSREVTLNTERVAPAR